MFGKGENKTATKMKKLGIKSVTFGERNNIRMIRAEEQIPVRFTFTRPLKKKEKVNVQCYMEEEGYALSKITGIYPILLLSGKTQKDKIILLEALYNRTSGVHFQKASPPLIKKGWLRWCFLSFFGKDVLPCFVGIFHKCDKIDVVHQRKTHHGDNLRECTVSLDAS